MELVVSYMFPDLNVCTPVLSLKPMHTQEKLHSAFEILVW